MRSNGLFILRQQRSSTDYIWNCASAAIIVSVRPSVHHNSHRHHVEDCEWGCTCRRFARIRNTFGLSVTWADSLWHLDAIRDSKTHASRCNAMTEHSHGADIIHAGSPEVTHSVTRSHMQTFCYWIVKYNCCLVHFILIWPINIKLYLSFWASLSSRF